MKQKMRWGGCLGALLILGMVLLFSNPKSVEAATKYKVVFANSKGSHAQNPYKKWTNNYKAGVEKNKTITLPKCTKKNYTLFWEVTSGNTTKKYAPGAKVKITKNTVFRLKFYKNYSVRFYTISGAKEFTSCRITAYYGQYVTLPKKSSTSSYKVLGWSTAVRNGGTTYSCGQKLQIIANTRLYLSATMASNSSVNLLTNTGELWKNISNTDGTATFPEVAVKSAKMVLGWSKTKGKTSYPEYYPGDTIPSRTGKYYMVTYPGSSENKTISNTKASRYKAVYLVGDSRTVDMKATLGSNVASNVEFVAKSGQGLSWFKETGQKELSSKIYNYYKKKTSKASDKVAVIINLGVNDLTNASYYVEYMEKYAAWVKNTRGYKNVKFFYMSVNPVNAAMIKNFNGSTKRTMEGVLAFNRTIRNGLCQKSGAYFTYINTCTPLQKTGWISNRLDKGVYDGLHYSKGTYIKIYNYLIKNYLS